VPTRELLLADTFLTLADTLVDDFDVVDVLTTLSGRCVELLDAAATGILLADPAGALQVMAASSEQVSLLELFQVQNEEGPCLDAFRSGQAVVHPDLAACSRWPRFGPLSIEAGFRAVHAFPMRVRTDTLGTLNLFMTTPGPLRPDDVVVAQALAHAAALALIQNRSNQDAHRMTAQLQGALNSRIAIEQAKGVISEVAGIAPDEAFNRLRAFSRNRNAKLTDVSVRLVNRSLPPADRATLVK